MQSGAPDLIVETLSVSDGTPDSGETFTLSAMVRNRGDGDAEATTLRYYRSTNANISASDLEVGTVRVDALSASGSGDESIALAAPSEAGTYYYGACADPVAGESDIANNCSAAVMVAVTARPRRPDLVVESPSVSGGSLEGGGAFTLSATVRNRGDGDAGATTLRYYRSTNANISASDLEVGTVRVDALSASGSGDESIALAAPSEAGTYYYGACADPVAGESDIANNCSAAVMVAVTARPRRPDLVVESPSVSGGSLEGGGAFTLSATVRNRGDGAAEATTLRYYRSTNANISTSDVEVGSDPVGVLSASGSSGESIALNAPYDPGTYYYGACVDWVAGETNTTNNCTAAVAVTVPQRRAPDLTASGSTTVSDFQPVCDGSPKTATAATVRNVGDGDAPATTLRYYRSADASVSSDDTEVGSAPVPALTASASWSDDLQREAVPGTHYYYVCVDAVPKETNSGNNCSAPVNIVAPELDPPDLEAYDFGMTPWSSDDTIVNIGVSVANEGDQTAHLNTLTITYRRSADATISRDDTEILEPSLQPDRVLAMAGRCRFRTGRAYRRSPGEPATSYYGVCLELDPPDGNPANDCTPALQFTWP